MPLQIGAKLKGRLTESLHQAESALSRQPRIVLWGGVAMLFLLSWVLYNPQLAAVHRLSREWHLLNTELGDARRVVDRIREGKGPSLQPIDSLPEVLGELNTVARSHQVEILEVTPSHPLPGGSPDLEILPVELQVEGGYRALGEFLGALGKTHSLGVAFVRRITMDRDERILPRLRARLSIDLAFSQGSDGRS